MSYSAHRNLVDFLSLRFTICPASKAEVTDLAHLAVMASDGLTLLTWEAARESDETAMQVGSNRAARTSGAFSYRNADIAMQNGKVIAAIISYALEQNLHPVASDEVPPIFQPLVALEALAFPSWYINILATYEEARGQGAATALIEEAEGRAKSAGFLHLSLIVGNNNPAKELYEALGFYETARAAVVDIPDNIRDTDWILMKKKIS